MSDFRIAVIGDVHKCWDEEDVRYFNDSAYDLVLLVGDLPGRSHRGLLKIAAKIGRVEKPLLMIPGNHDAVTIRQLWGELTQDRKMIDKNAAGMQERVTELGDALGDGRLCGYSVHSQSKNGVAFDIIAARPHTMGGDALPGFLPYLKERFDVDSMEASSRLMNRLIDESPNRRVLFLAHNGPAGLGDERTSIFGRDFDKEGGDFGDPDLANSLAYARERKQVLGVIAGHMHHRCKGGGTRPKAVARDEVFFLNSAVVPRTYKQDGVTLRHHFELRISENENDPGRIFEVIWNGSSEERIEITPDSV